MRTRIKICGVKDIDTALTAAEAGADAVGLVFVESSPRYVEPEEGYEIMASLPPLVMAVGVFANHGLDAFSDIEERCPTPLTQLHGTEDEKLVRKCGPDVIKAIRFDAETFARDVARWDALDEVSAILVDGSNPGSGVALDWGRLAEALEPMREGLRVPLILAGGLTAETVGEAIRAIGPWAVDVSSGVESSPGVKDPERIHAFCAAVREADRE
jgi:phosphoribosylanthranilate isomerase